MEEVLKDIEKGSEDAVQASLSQFNSKVHYVCMFACTCIIIMYLPSGNYHPVDIGLCVIDILLFCEVMFSSLFTVAC